MSELRRSKRKIVIEISKQEKKTGKGICKHITRPSQRIRDVTGSGNDYTDTYYYCDTLKKRITKKTCHNCKLFENYTHPI
jgi:hypothetical protein